MAEEAQLPTTVISETPTLEALSTQNPLDKAPTATSTAIPEPTATPKPTAKLRPQEGDIRTLEDGTLQVYLAESWLVPEDGMATQDRTKVWDGAGMEWRDPQSGDVYTSAEGTNFTYDAGNMITNGTEY